MVTLLLGHIGMQNPKRRRVGLLKLELGVSDFAMQDFLSHGISIPIGSSNRFTKKLVKLLCQNFRIDQSATTIADLSMPFG